MLYALEFYDVSRPDIAKIKLNISAKNESALNTVLIQNMERHLKHSLLFENAGSWCGIPPWNRKDHWIWFNSFDRKFCRKRFEPLVFGVKFKNRMKDIFPGKALEVSNLMLKQLFGIKWPLGSRLFIRPIMLLKPRLKPFLKYQDDGKTVDLQPFSNYGVSWDPTGKYSIHCDTAWGTRVFMQGFRPLRSRVWVFFDEGTGSAAEFCSTGKFLFLYVNRSNTDIYEYYLDGENFMGCRLRNYVNPTD